MLLGSLLVLPVQVSLLTGKTGLDISVLQEVLCWQVHEEHDRSVLIWNSLLAHAVQTRSRIKEVSVFTHFEACKVLFDKHRDFFLQCLHQKLSPFETRGHRI